jgi:hypothetical protein
MAARTPLPRVPVSWGELLDRITILELKLARATNRATRAAVAAELETLAAARDAEPPLPAAAAALVDELSALNRELWEVEDALRACECAHDFGPAFIELARNVYRLNDRRAELKRRLSERLGSPFGERKIYAPD